HPRLLEGCPDAVQLPVEARHLLVPELPSALLRGDDDERQVAQRRLLRRSLECGLSLRSRQVAHDDRHSDLPMLWRSALTEELERGGGTAVDDEVRAVDVPGLVGEEERGERPDLLRVDHPPGGDLLLDLPPHHVDDHGCVHRARADRVDRDTGAPQVDDEGAGEVGQPALGGRVARVGVPGDAGDRGDVDDPPPPPLDHAWRELPDDAEGPGEVDVERSEEAVAGVVAQPLPVEHPGGVDDRVDRAGRRLDGRAELAHRRVMRDVEREGPGPAALRQHVLGGPLGGRRLDVGAHHAVAGRGEPGVDAAGHAATGTGDEDRAAAARGHCAAPGVRRSMRAVRRTAQTSSSRWLYARCSMPTIPASGRDFDSRLSSASVSTRRVSPMSTGLGNSMSRKPRFPSVVPRVVSWTGIPVATPRVKMLLTIRSPYMLLAPNSASRWSGWTFIVSVVMRRLSVSVTVRVTPCLMTSPTTKSS